MYPRLVPNNQMDSEIGHIEKYQLSIWNDSIKILFGKKTYCHCLADAAHSSSNIDCSHIVNQPLAVVWKRGKGKYFVIKLDEMELDWCKHGNWSLINGKEWNGTWKMETGEIKKAYRGHQHTLQSSLHSSFPSSQLRPARTHRWKSGRNYCCFNSNGKIAVGVKRRYALCILMIKSCVGLNVKRSCEFWNLRLERFQ